MIGMVEKETKHLKCLECRHFDGFICLKQRDIDQADDCVEFEPMPFEKCHTCKHRTLCIWSRAIENPESAECKGKVVTSWAELRDSDLFETIDVWVEIIPNGSRTPKDLKMALSILEKYGVIGSWYAVGFGLKKKLGFKISIDLIKANSLLRHLFKGDQ